MSFSCVASSRDSSPASRPWQSTSIRVERFSTSGKIRTEKHGRVALGGTGLEEEQPDAYKDVQAVVGVLHEAGISQKVARLKTIGVIKG